MAEITITDLEEPQYVGFWPRVGAYLIDTLVVGGVLALLGAVLYGGSMFAGPDNAGFGAAALFLYLMYLIVPFAYYLYFWSRKGATPGLMVISAEVIDAQTGEYPSIGKCIVRVIGIVIASIPLYIGLMWVGFDDRKQGWHDKIAGTLVVRWES